MKNPVTRKQLSVIYQRLLRSFGPQDWWPAKTPFEVIVGAILTQNTAWANVEKAIANLKRAHCLNPAKIKNLSFRRLAELIRPSGYYNIKAKRLKSFINFFFKEYRGQVCRMSKAPTGILRRQLLEVKGIGPETADSILLYACEKPVFVVDAYTKRMLSRHHLLDGKLDYATVQRLFMQSLKPQEKLFNEFHALLVRLGKDYCKKIPRCNVCPLKSCLP
ncbi:MAG: endonuclease III domain-containing protein [Candidatus Omnitrophota bacterium]